MNRVEQSIRVGFIVCCMLSLFACQQKSVKTDALVHGLLFQSNDYKIENVLIYTAQGEKRVTFHHYQRVPYVLNPVDIHYQSLDILVPEQIDGIHVDTQNAPILLNIDTVSYLSVENYKKQTDMPVMGGPPNGGSGGPGGGSGGPTGGSMGRPDMQRNGPNMPGASIDTQLKSAFPETNENATGKVGLALAAGYVIVTPGVRGRDNVDENEHFFGKAPAVIVDYKAAIRYLRHNADIIPGNKEWIIAIGCSTGGGIAALIASSGNSPLYDKYLKEIGAADARDDIYASACYSPMTDLEHADMAYEWMFGQEPHRLKLVDQLYSKQLRNQFSTYLSSLNLDGQQGFGKLSSQNYATYLLSYYLQPAASHYIAELSAERRDIYLSRHPWIHWQDGQAEFSFADYVHHIKRLKGLPAFDSFDKTSAENMLFGNETNNARHFTQFSAGNSKHTSERTIDSDLDTIRSLMNPMYFLTSKNSDIAQFWWLRNGSDDNQSSQTTMINLATLLENTNKHVNTGIYWNAGHCADDDPQGMIDWVAEITGWTLTQKR